MINNELTMIEVIRFVSELPFQNEYTDDEKREALFWFAAGNKNNSKYFAKYVDNVVNCHGYLPPDPNGPGFMASLIYTELFLKYKRPEIYTATNPLDKRQIPA